MTHETRKLKFVLNPNAETKPFHIIEDKTSDKWLDTFSDLELSEEENNYLGVFRLGGIDTIPLSHLTFYPQGTMEIGEINGVFNYNPTERNELTVPTEDQSKGIGSVIERPLAFWGEKRTPEGKQSEAVASLKMPYFPKNVHIIGRDGRCGKDALNYELQIERKRQKVEVTLETRDIDWQCQIDRRSFSPTGGKFVTCTGKVNVDACQD